MLPILAGLKLASSVGFLKKHWALIVSAVCLVAFLGIFYMFAQSRQRTVDMVEITELQAAVQHLITENRRVVAEAAEATKRWDQHERKLEQEKIASTEDLRKKHVADIADWQDRVRNLNATRKQLLDHIGRFARLTDPSRAGADPAAVCGNLPERLAACGSLFERSDETAGRCSADYGTARKRLDACVEQYEKVAVPR